MRTEQFQPQLSDRNDRDKWEKAGALDTKARAAQKVRQILEQPEQLVLSSDIRSQIKKEIPRLQPGVM
jgi:trimethylamine:corrinoid methyltransferase-like protein